MHITKINNIPQQHLTIQHINKQFNIGRYNGCDPADVTPKMAASVCIKVQVEH